MWVLLVGLAFSSCDCGPPPGSDAGPDAGPGCTAGEVGCACRADASCDDGLACESDVCVGVAPQGLVFPADAAGCELLLVETSGALRVTFGEGTAGTFVREQPKVGVSLVGDAGALSATVSGGDFTIASSRCVDAAGADVTGQVEVQR